MDKTTSELRIGETVRLLSGGPLMTVESSAYSPYDAEHMANVAWFDAGQQLQRAKFTSAILERVEKP